MAHSSIKVSRKEGKQCFAEGLRQCSMPSDNNGLLGPSWCFSSNCPTAICLGLLRFCRSSQSPRNPCTMHLNQKYGQRVKRKRKTAQGVSNWQPGHCRSSIFHLPTDSSCSMSPAGIASSRTSGARHAKCTHSYILGHLAQTHRCLCAHARMD